MSSLLSKVGFLALLMSVTFSSWASSCQPIALACMKMGYYKGGDKVGKGLVKDCVMPVASGSRTLPNTSFTASQLQQCRMIITEKMKGHL